MGTHQDDALAPDALAPDALASLFEGTALPVIAVDHQRRAILRANRAALTMLGLDASVIVGRPATELLTEPSAEQQHHIRALLGEETAAILNGRFVSIKVDREERPDLDDVYMAAVQAMTGSGGWPMSVFLTPDLRPFFGGTYFPPDDRHGMAGFPRVLSSVADAYRTRRAEVDQQAGMLAAHLKSALAVPNGDRDPERRQIDAAVVRLAATFDATHGGFGGAPKFPAPMTLEFLLRSWRRSGEPATLAMVTRTLDAMADGGIHDQLGGGFARYSTDAHWLVPHFEKMLYDNALLAHAYLEGFRATGTARYAQVARSTLDFMLAELRTADGGFAAALDADSEGAEGRFYAWEHAELIVVLTAAGFSEAERDAVAASWGVTPAGNWEGTNVLHRARPEPDAELLERASAALLAARARRPRPARDDKQVAAWNGLALRAFAHAALVLPEPRYVTVAAELVAFVRDVLVRDRDRLWRTARDGRGRTPAFCEDAMAVADGLLGAHAALGTAEPLLLARALVDRAIGDFWDDAGGTFVDTSSEHDRTVAQPRGLVDNATPSANSLAADVLIRLALLTGEADYARRSGSILRTVAPALERQPSAFGRMLCAADRALGEPIDVVVAGPTAAADGARLLREAAVEPYVPDLVLAGLEDGAPHGSWPLFEGKSAAEPRAYACRGYACDAPTDDASTLVAQVKALAPVFG